VGRDVPAGGAHSAAQTDLTGAFQDRYEGGVGDTELHAPVILRDHAAAPHDAAPLEHFGIGLADEPGRAMDLVRHRRHQRRLHGAEPADTDLRPESVLQVRVAACVVGCPEFRTDLAPEGEPLSRGDLGGADQVHDPPGCGRGPPCRVGRLRQEFAVVSGMAGHGTR
jgi:hypothetical protein